MHNQYRSTVNGNSKWQRTQQLLVYIVSICAIPRQTAATCDRRFAILFTLDWLLSFQSILFISTCLQGARALE